MPRKKKRRPTQPATSAGDTPEPAGPDAGTAEDEAVRAERRAQQKREWAEQRRQRERAQRSNAPHIWGAGIAAAVALLVVGGILLFTGGGGGDDGGGSAQNPTPTPTPDRRIAGLPIDVTLTLDMDDNGQNVNPRFEPSTITAEAGQVIEILAPNIGSVAHNLRLAGANDVYEEGAPSSDDWVTFPMSVQPGETGRVVVKLDEPGEYPFKCDFHPTQVGMLILR